MPSNKVAGSKRAPARGVWVIGVAVIVLILITALLLIQPTGQVLSFSATTVTGEHVSLADYRGKVVMVNFWATWCPPCRAEMPIIESAFEQYDDRGFIVLAVNNGEGIEQVSWFTDQYQLTFPVLLDTTGQIQDQFGITGYPTSMFLDGEGQVYRVHTGAVTAEQLATYIEIGLSRSSS